MPHKPDDYIKAAKKNGLRVENGKGDHVKVYAPDGSMVVVPRYNRELSTGTDHAIGKWFKLLGIVVVLTALAYIVLVGG